jgi:hypothetical protein
VIGPTPVPGHLKRFKLPKPLKQRKPTAACADCYINKQDHTDLLFARSVHLLRTKYHFQALASQRRRRERLDKDSRGQVLLKRH